MRKTDRMGQDRKPPSTNALQSLNRRLEMLNVAVGNMAPRMATKAEVEALAQQIDALRKDMEKWMAEDRFSVTRTQVLRILKEELKKDG